MENAMSWTRVPPTRAVTSAAPLADSKNCISLDFDASSGFGPDLCFNSSATNASWASIAFCSSVHGSGGVAGLVSIIAKYHNVGIGKDTDHAHDDFVLMVCH